MKHILLYENFKPTIHAKVKEIKYVVDNKIETVFITDDNKQWHYKGFYNGIKLNNGDDVNLINVVSVKYPYNNNIGFINQELNRGFKIEKDLSRIHVTECTTNDLSKHILNSNSDKDSYFFKYINTYNVKYHQLRSLSDDFLKKYLDNFASYTELANMFSKLSTNNILSNEELGKHLKYIYCIMKTEPQSYSNLTQATLILIMNSPSSIINVLIDDFKMYLKGNINMLYDYIFSNINTVLFDKFQENEWYINISKYDVFYMLFLNKKLKALINLISVCDLELRTILLHIKKLNNLSLLQLIINTNKYELSDIEKECERIKFNNELVRKMLFLNKNNKSVKIMSDNTIDIDNITEQDVLKNKNELSKQLLPDSFIDKYSSILNWNLLPIYQVLSEDMIMKHKDSIKYWDSIFENQVMSYKFINNLIDNVLDKNDVININIKTIPKDNIEEYNKIVDKLSELQTPNKNTYDPSDGGRYKLD